MRFKAKLSPHHVELLHNLISPISRLHGSSKGTNNGTGSGVGANDDGAKSKSGDTIIYLDNDKMILSTHGVSSSAGNSSGGGSGGVALLTNQGGPSSQHQTQTQSHPIQTQTMTQSGSDAEGIFCFAELMTTQGIFREHVIESLSEGNAILMEINLSCWRTALKNILKSHCGKDANGIMNGTGNGESMVGSVVVGGDRDADDQEDGYGDDNPQQSTGKRKRASAAAGFLGVADITMKLAKRNGGLPHLCLDAKNNGGRGLLGIEAHYAIPVRILRTDELQ